MLHTALLGAAWCAEVKKRRGGRRLRKMKERYGLTDVSNKGLRCPAAVPVAAADAWWLLPAHA
jgi:hypothetical protein